MTSLTLETQAAAQHETVGTEMGSEVPLFSKLPAGSSGWKLISRLLSPLSKSQCQEGREARAGASREHRQVMGTGDCARSTPPPRKGTCVPWHRQQGRSAGRAGDRDTGERQSQMFLGRNTGIAAVDRKSRRTRGVEGMGQTLPCAFAAGGSHPFCCCFAKAVYTL